MLTGLRFGVSTAFDAVPIFFGRKFHMQTAFRNKGRQGTKVDNDVTVSNPPIYRLEPAKYCAWSYCKTLL